MSATQLGQTKETFIEGGEFYFSSVTDYLDDWY